MNHRDSTHRHRRRASIGGLRTIAFEVVGGSLEGLGQPIASLARVNRRAIGPIKRRNFSTPTNLPYYRAKRLGPAFTHFVRGRSEPVIAAGQ